MREIAPNPEALLSVPSSKHNDHVIFYIMQSRLHWVHWAVIIASKEIKTIKQAVAGKSKDKTITIPETLERIRKPGSATKKIIIIAVYEISLTTYDIKKHRERNTSVNFGQNRYCLINGILNNLVTLQSCRCQIK